MLRFWGCGVSVSDVLFMNLLNVRKSYEFLLVCWVSSQRDF